MTQTGFLADFNDFLRKWRETRSQQEVRLVYNPQTRSMMEARS